MTIPHVDHIGVLVPDMDRAVEMFRKLFGMEPESTADRPDVGLRIAMFEAANITIELLQYTDDGPGLARDVMGDGMGINHVSFTVDDIDESVAEIERHGADLVDGFPLEGAHGRVAFFDPRKTEGFLFELCEPGSD